MARRGAFAALLLALSLLAAGCVSVPADGPVVVDEGNAAGELAPGIYFDPQPPRDGQSAGEVVTGFLEAMKAMPIRTSVAAQFLTEDARSGWTPESATWTYAEASTGEGGFEVPVFMEGVNTYRGNGAWAARSRQRDLVLSLTTEDGEWRIDEVPDALIVPESWFEDWYQRVSLYYFDPSFQTLVPEPVFVPKGDQFATSLVRGLLAPRDRASRAATRTSFPAGLQAPLAVPVNQTGLADVRLEGDAPVDDVTVQRMVAQLSWTLRQDPTQRAMRLSVGDAAVPLPGGAAEIGLGVGAALDPSGDQASPDVFGLRRGRLVRGPLTDLQPTQGPFGARQLGVRSIGVSLGGDRVAGVSGDGSALLVGPVDDPDGQAVQVSSDFVDLLPPAWDGQDHIWLVDHDRGRARVAVIAGDRPARPVEVPGITGQDVRRFLVSRDGTRLVAVVSGARTDRVVAARIVHDNAGRVVRATRAVEIGRPAEPTRVRDIGWRSPTSVSILTRVTEDLAQVRTVPVEGAPGDLVTAGTSRIRGRALGLVTSPVEGEGAYVVTAGAVSDLTVPGQSIAEVGAALRTLVLVGS